MRARRTIRVGLILAFLATTLWQLPTASADFAAHVQPQLPATATLGQSTAASILISNDSDAEEADSELVLDDIRYTPSCATTTITLDGDCPAGPDVGVFTLGPMTGRADTACEGRTFTTTVINATTGQLNLEPDDDITLEPSEEAHELDTCVIDFTVTPNRRPLPLEDEPQTIAVAFASGVPILDGERGDILRAFGTDRITIERATPELSTIAQPPTQLGEMRDLAIIEGGFEPTGLINFELYRGEDCDDDPIFTDVEVEVDGEGRYFSALSPPVGPGTYNWIARYSGDENNNPVEGQCGDEGETIVIPEPEPERTTPDLSTVALPPNELNELQDVATLANSDNASGEISFELYRGPGCADDPIFTGTPAVVDGDGQYFSSVTPQLEPGTYHWIARYSGDERNFGVVGTCNDENETVVIPEPEPEPERQPTTIRTVASGVNPATGEIRDTATLAGGDEPTGSITFRLYGPSPTPVCTQGNLQLTSVVSVDGNGAYNSGTFAPATPGTYRWVASYSGDENNLPSQGECNDPDEDVTVLARTPISIGVTKTATPTSRPVPGGTFTFTVVVHNTGERAVRIESLVDDVYGNLAARANSDCDELINVVVQPGQSSDPCSFTVTFTAPAPTSERDVVTATARDTFEQRVQAQDDETIFLTRRTPTIVTTASPNIILGDSVSDAAQLQGHYAATGSVTFRLYGPSNETCAGPPVFSTTEPISDLGSAVSRSFQPTAPGTYRWIATYNGDANNAPAAGACNDPRERVVVTPVATHPVIVVQKDALPASQPAPGGEFEFRVRVTNLSDRQLTLTNLHDSIYGDLDGLGTCNTPQVLDSGETYDCTFIGVFIGEPGDSETDVVEAVAVDPDGRSARDTDDATVTLTARRPILVVDDFGDPPTTRPTVSPPTVLPRVIVRTGAGSASTAATAITLVSFGLLCIGLADERKRRLAKR